MIKIKSTGRRQVTIFRSEDGNISLEILLLDKHLATLVFEPKEAHNLLDELGKVIRRNAISQT